MALTMLRDPLFADFRLMDDFFGRMFGNVNRVTGFVPALDVRETEDEYLVLVDLPGVKSEDVVIELIDQALTISGSRAPVETGEALRLERPSGSFVRRLTLPTGVDSDKVVADYKEGVLELRIPKRAEAKPKKIAIGETSQKAIDSRRSGPR
jgi:HSP20 family protein